MASLQYTLLIRESCNSEGGPLPYSAHTGAGSRLVSVPEEGTTESWAALYVPYAACGRYRVVPTHLEVQHVVGEQVVAQQGGAVGQGLDGGGHLGDGGRDVGQLRDEGGR